MEDSVSPYWQHINQYFSTADQDNDSNPGGSCAVEYDYTGWWFNKCSEGNLNGKYGSTVYAHGIQWYLMTNYAYSLKTSQMKVLPAV